MKPMLLEGDESWETERIEALVREKKSMCILAMTNGLTLELTYCEGSSYGVWLFGDQLLWWVVAGTA